MPRLPPSDQPSAAEQAIERALILFLLALMLCYLGKVIWDMRAAKFVRNKHDPAPGTRDIDDADDHLD